jgi:glutamate/tyrosine decarboxylase-like PLP-dependent enzyme
VPIECGCALVRDAEAMRDAFSLVPPYLRDAEALPWFSEYGVQQTRGFKALKLWLTLQNIGMEGYQELIGRDIALAKVLQAKLEAHPHFEMVAAGPLSITCFRYAPPQAEDVAALNRSLLKIVQNEGAAFLTGTELEGEFVLRACIVNFRTTENDLDILLQTIERAGEHVMKSVQKNS